ncbi:hypothetical protein F0L68_06225 [Solihabitans fulvus]|uniref:Uncharacterized protein n=1 Tax=Solihabitans fulvus TaxID=1892852 RepID=A0A5B2XNF2_9PSEU|nr:hypothetical protein [Solihabitans fulvus]KAA2264685.1 hypothetical protein F0L68_06225 [Solihabitans fulvus]
MSAEDRLNAALAKQDVITREHAERRDLRERRGNELAAQSKEGFAKQGQLMGKFFERMQEMNKKQKAAGGWGTSAATEKDSGVLNMGFEDDTEQPKDEFDDYRPAPGGWGAQPEPVVEAPAPPPPPPAAPTRASRRSVQHSDDDDDLSGQSWLT